jgi:hypothetical protein
VDATSKELAAQFSTARFRRHRQPTKMSALALAPDPARSTAMSSMKALGVNEHPTMAVGTNDAGAI